MPFPCELWSPSNDDNHSRCPLSWSRTVHAAHLPTHVWLTDSPLTQTPQARQCVNRVVCIWGHVAPGKQWNILALTIDRQHLPHISRIGRLTSTPTLKHHTSTAYAHNAHCCLRMLHFFLHAQPLHILLLLGWCCHPLVVSPSCACCFQRRWKGCLPMSPKAVHCHAHLVSGNILVLGGLSYTSVWKSIQSYCGCGYWSYVLNRRGTQSGKGLPVQELTDGCEWVSGMILHYV